MSQSSTALCLWSDDIALRSCLPNPSPFATVSVSAPPVTEAGLQGAADSEFDIPEDTNHRKVDSRYVSFASYLSDADNKRGACSLLPVSTVLIS